MPGGGARGAECFPRHNLLRRPPKAFARSAAASLEEQVSPPGPLPPTVRGFLQQQQQQQPAPFPLERLPARQTGGWPRWLVLAIAMARFYMDKGTHKGLYKSIQKTLKFFQTFALLEIVHCAVGVVHTSVLVTGVQVSSRIFMVWFITHSIKQIQNEDSVVLFLVVWTVTEITRYSFYTFNMLNHLPYFIKWARYNFFIILYPVGVVGELLTIYAALPYAKRSGMFSVRLPNKYNVSFDYYYFLIIVMASYIPLFPQLYFHMLRQRRRVLHGEVIVEKDD
ncbi:very-long-chain (3R)-3-hydroxyacyl-CoA dehydratase 1 isoform X3 [Hemicordylus capensis]|uniref:very-long-chain (3R)-3-hydroxyacyl-CoA dehydratase 1 isoform X3 n=1 Tax=Hemicordylus capensis TaxID=884348 RepID=UPI0023029ACC|nr:very-long-chain (3R)-3-hydroxyacyl-CoA dehydratase 1 isoform X3 [Hemicordylus capensis]